MHNDPALLLDGLASLIKSGTGKIGVRAQREKLIVLRSKLLDPNREIVQRVRYRVEISRDPIP